MAPPGNRRKSSRGRSETTRGGPLRRWLRRILLAGFCFGLGGVAGLVATFYYFSFTLPAIGPLLEGYAPPQVSRVVTRDGEVIAELFEERRSVVPLDEIPEVMVEASIAAEDADFRSHEGLDYRGMVRAILTNLTSGRLAQGASTITQQVARTFFLTRQKTFARKIREILLTKRIEERLTKDEILYLYLNQINFGHARYGVQEATRFYFDKDASELTLAEAALLAGIPKGPAIYSPVTHPEAARGRRAYVLGELAKLGKISAEEAASAVEAPLGVVKRRGFDSRLAPEAVTRALDSLEGVVDEGELRRGGYRVETTIDSRLQAAARRAVLDGLQAIDGRHGRLAPYKRKKWPRGDRGDGGRLREGRVYLGKVVGHDDPGGKLLVDVGGRRGAIRLEEARRYNPKKLKASGFAVEGAVLRVSLAAPPPPEGLLRLHLEQGPQAALVAIRVEDGSIAAIVGGDAVTPGGFDRAAAARRQPGSAFKPFVYLTAIRSGRYTASTLLDDSPEVQGDWRPKNASTDSYEGALRLRRAIAKSLNLPAVKLITDLGPEAVVETARLAGIDSPLDPTPALGLGASAVSPFEIAGAYGTIARLGKRIEPRVVERVVGPDGYEVPARGRSSRQVFPAAEAFLVVSLLRSVVEEGTGGKARALKRPAAGKTGTSNDQRDAWFVGFTADLVCAVWVGFDDMRSVGRKEYGGRAALPIWVDFMKAAHQGLPARDFVEPPGLVTIEIDPATGLLPYEGMEGTIEEIYIEGTEPTAMALAPDLVSLTGFLMDELAGDGGVDKGDAGALERR